MAPAAPDRPSGAWRPRPTRGSGGTTGEWKPGSWPARYCEVQRLALGVGFEVDLATETGIFGFDEHWLEKEFLTGEDMAAYNDPAHPFDDFSITDGRVVTGANPASAHSNAERAVKAFDSL